MNQLWRNHLLACAATAVEYQHVYFSVVKHPDNIYLDNSLAAYTALINGHPTFSAMTSQQILAAAEANGDAQLREWVAWYKELYNIH